MSSVSQLLLVFLILTFTTYHSISQENTFEDGVYRTADDFLNNSPATTSVFQLIKRSDKRIKHWGGSRYKLVPEDEALSTKKFFQYGVWGIVQNDTLYINNQKYSYNSGYNRVMFLTENFALVVGYVLINDERKTWASSNEGEYKNVAIPYRRGVAYSFEKSKFFILNDGGMEWLIQDYPELVEEFHQLLDLKFTDNNFEIIKRFEIIKKLDRLMQTDKQ